MRDSSQPGRAPILLLVEDNPADRRILSRALERLASRARLFVAVDGEEALDFLHRRGRFTDPLSSPRPDLVLLDLNLPKMDGRTVARQLRADPRFTLLPLVALTTSSDLEDVKQSYAAGFNSYIVKPRTFEELMHTLEVMQHYWFEVVALPPAA